MRRLIVCLAVVGSLWCAQASRAQDEARALVERGIKAQGGPEALAKVKVMRSVTEGTAAFIPNLPESPVTVEEFYSRPDKFKSVITMKANNMEVSFSQVINGDDAWMVINGMVIDLPPDALAEIKSQAHTDMVTSLSFLDKPGVKLSLAGEQDVEGKPAAGVLVKLEGQRDVTLYFDKESGLLVKAVFKTMVPMVGEATQEIFWSEYQEQDGVKYASKIQVRQNGRKVLDGKVTKVELLEKIDDKEFARP